MYKLCVFAGTSEGRKLVEFLSRQNAEVTACVATDYGETLLPNCENVLIHAHPMLRDEMRAMMLREKFDLVVDATHPYAVSITESISTVCGETGTEYLRLQRAGGDMPEDAIYVESLDAAIEYLGQTRGNILLTTGSKQLKSFAALEGFAERAYARVLPMQASLDICAEVGLTPSHIIAMQGPFSTEMNVAMLRAVKAKYMVSKDSGSAGGFEEKAAAARIAGAKLVVIGRPPQHEGTDYADTVKLLCSRFGFTVRPKVCVAGIGPGSPETMTQQLRNAVETAQCLVGAGRMLEAFGFLSKPGFKAISPEEIRNIIDAHPEYTSFAVLMSGDSGFFSGAKKLLERLENCDVELLPGISSVSYLAAKLCISYDDAESISLHGRDGDIASALRRKRKLFVLVGGDNAAAKLCARLASLGYADAKVFVGERLSYGDERIVSGTAEELMHMSFNNLCLVYIEHNKAFPSISTGIEDEAFERGQGERGIVPMTKSELRAVCLSKLRLCRDSCCWDVGAGTGSVAVEMALQCSEGHVWAIEQSAAAIELIEKNKARFSVENLSLIHGTAPEACAGLEAPSHVFIGGSRGNAREIIDAALALNPCVRIVATAVSLEAQAELAGCMKDFEEHEALTVNISRSKSAGAYQLMTAQNPVTVFTMQNRGAE